PEVCDPECLANRGLLRLAPLRLLQCHRSLCRPPGPQMPPALLEQVIRFAHVSSRSTSSRMADAIAAFGALGTGRSLSLEISVTSLSSASKPMPSCPTSL